MQKFGITFLLKIGYPAKKAKTAHFTGKTTVIHIFRKKVINGNLGYIRFYTLIKLHGFSYNVYKKAE